jgi:endonuclease/exonuclease/phosphatase family metal-dependent hydrolase
MDGGLRVATFNIRNGIAMDGLDSWPFRRRAAADAVARLNLDLAGLQEVYGFQQGYLLRRLPGYAVTGVGRTDGRGRGERCTVLYRRARLALDDSTTRWFSDTPEVAGSTSWGNRLPRIVTLARFTDRESGRRFGLANCHLEGSPATARHRSAAALAAWLEPGLPWIVLGDFNAEPDDEAVRTLLAAGLRDVFAAGPRAAPAAGSAAPNLESHHRADSEPETQPVLETDSCARSTPAAPAAPAPLPTTTGGFSGTGKRQRIDYVFVTREWEVGEAAGSAGPPHRRRASDHWPVVAALRLRPDV